VRERDRLLILTAAEHHRLVEVAVPTLAAAVRDDREARALVEKLVNAPIIHDVGEDDGNEEGPHQVTPKARC
jgi:hypothetical protein